MRIIKCVAIIICLLSGFGCAGWHECGPDKNELCCFDEDGAPEDCTPAEANELQYARLDALLDKLEDRQRRQHAFLIVFASYLF